MTHSVRGRRQADRIFYGWWIVASGFLVQLVSGSVLFHSFSAYFVFLEAEFRWSRTLLAGAFSLVRVESGLLGPLEGWLIDRVGPRAMMRVGVLLFGTGFMAFSLVNSLLAFYLSFALIALGSALAGFLPVTAAVTHWFARRRATAMGIMMTGFGLGGLLVPLVVWSLTTFGWRATALGSGVLIIAVGLPAVQLMRHHPEQYGYLPDGAAVLDDGALAPRFDGLTARQALDTRGFWFLAIGHSVALLAVGATMVHQIPHMVAGIGLSVHLAGGIVALLMATVIVSQLASGYVGDRIDKRAVIVGCMLLHSVALVVFATATTFVGAVIFAILHGVAWGARGPLMQAIRADYFGRIAYGTIMGFSSLIATVGMVLGPLFAGAMADWLGDYRVGFLVLAGVTAGGSALFLLARPPRPAPTHVAQRDGSTPD